jgi:hypothetical protein
MISSFQTSSFHVSLKYFFLSKSKGEKKYLVFAEELFCLSPLLSMRSLHGLKKFGTHWKHRIERKIGSESGRRKRKERKRLQKERE